MSELSDYRRIVSDPLERQLRKRVRELTAAVSWALGEEGEFPAKRVHEGQFWWRAELRQRAFGAEPASGAGPDEAHSAAQVPGDKSRQDHTKAEASQS